MALMKQPDSKKTRSVPPYAGFQLFSEVFRQRNLKLAADEIGMPAATASHMLAALRDFFGDPLFVKTRGGFSPTPRAEELYPKIASLVADTKRLADGEEFDLSAAEAVFRIACADNAPYMFFCSGLDIIVEKAPRLTVIFEHLQSNFYNRLECRELDFAVVPIEGELPPRFHGIPLGENRFSLVARKDHPLARLAEEPGLKALPDEEILKYPFIDISVAPQFYRVATLREQVFPAWASGRSAFCSEYFLPFVPMLENTDLLMVLPQRTAEDLEKHYAIRTLPAGMDSALNHPRLIWHELTHKDPLHQWFRSLLVDSCRQK